MTAEGVSFFFFFFEVTATQTWLCGNSTFRSFQIPHFFGSFSHFSTFFMSVPSSQDVGSGPHDLLAGHLLLADHWLDGRVEKTSGMARVKGSYGRASGAK